MGNEPQEWSEYTLGEIIEGLRTGLEKMHSRLLTLEDIGLDAYNETVGEVVNEA